MRFINIIVDGIASGACWTFGLVVVVVIADMVGVWDGLLVIFRNALAIVCT